jgi:hypothetical protein
MIDFSSATVAGIAIHEVGNKLRNEEIRFSKKPLEIEDAELESVLLKYLLHPFKGEEFFHFSHPTILTQNEIYSFCWSVFEYPGMFFDNSKAIARHLYEQSTHPKVKAGELYVLQLNNCKIDGIFTDAIGLFKSETKETFLKIKHDNDDFDLEYENGININKLDKGCLVFNIDKEKGFKVAVVDNQGSNEAQYWKNDFLGLTPCEDDYSHTKNYLAMTRSFVTEKLDEDFNIEKADQIRILNDSLSYFKKNDKFNEEKFAEEVIMEPSIIGAFNDYKKAYQQEREIPIMDDFDISSPAVKKQARNFKSILKLDKNFHIYIHGSRELIEKGYDDATGMHYYKVFFKEEA